MRICLILEGCYPYVRGGVSSWANDLIKSFSEHEFVLCTIGAQKEKRGKFLYELPENVVKVHEIFLDEALELNASKHGKLRFTDTESEEIQKMINDEDPDWDVLFNCFNQKGANAPVSAREGQLFAPLMRIVEEGMLCYKNTNLNPIDFIRSDQFRTLLKRKGQGINGNHNARNTNPISFLKSELFLTQLKKMCQELYPFAAYSNLFYTMHTILSPLIYIIGQDIPQADLYHATATGYSGVLGAMGGWKYQKPFIVTEHGIYTREREEEILRSETILPYLKDMWIQFFYMLSRCAYTKASVVTSLFERARTTQIELGCPPEICQVVSNGVYVENFLGIPPKEPDGFMDIGAVVRIAPIKDIKTMIYSFAELKHTVPNARLHILGDVDDKEYNKECHALVEQLGVDDIIFVGNTNVIQYMRKLDFTILTSISEAQPLAAIESMAAGRCCIVTDVGACREMVEGGEKDKLGQSGICIPPMHREALTAAMIRLCASKELRDKMGAIGKIRAQRYFNHDIMIQAYQSAYERAIKQWQA